MGNVIFSLVDLKTRRVESLRRFCGSLDIELDEEQHLPQMRDSSYGLET